MKVQVILIDIQPLAFLHDYHNDSDQLLLLLVGLHLHVTQLPYTRLQP